MGVDHDFAERALTCFHCDQLITEPSIFWTGGITYECGDRPGTGPDDPFCVPRDHGDLPIRIYLHRWCVLHMCSNLIADAATQGVRFFDPRIPRRVVAAGDRKHFGGAVDPATGAPYLTVED